MSEVDAAAGLLPTASTTSNFPHRGKCVHRGEILAEEFLVPLGLGQNALARALGVPPRRINEIVLGKRAITADTALRLARYFGNSPDFLMALQASYDLEEAQGALGAHLERQIQPRAA